MLESLLTDEEVDILDVLISLNKNCSLQVWFAVLVTIATELHIKIKPETKMPGLTPFWVRLMDSTGRGCSNKHQDLEKGCAFKKHFKEFHFYQSQIFNPFSPRLDKLEYQLVRLWHDPLPMCCPSKPDSVLFICLFFISLTFQFNSLLALPSLSRKYSLNGGSWGCFGQISSILQLHYAKNKSEMCTVFTWSRSVPKEPRRQFIQQ